MVVVSGDGGTSRWSEDEEEQDVHHDLEIFDNGSWVNATTSHRSSRKNTQVVSSSSNPSSSSDELPPVKYNKKRKRDVSTKEVPAKKSHHKKKGGSRPLSDKEIDIVKHTPSTVTENEVSRLLMNANVSSKDFEFLVPLKDQWANKPPEGYITVYAEQVSAGLRFPLHDLVVKVCDLVKVSPSQLVPNAHRLIVGFILCAKLNEIPPTADTFFSLFTMNSASVSGLFQFSRFGKKFLEVPSSNGPWKRKFFFLRPTGKSWNCPTKWSETFSKPPSNVALSKLALKKGIMDHCFHANKLTCKEILVHGGIEQGVPPPDMSFKFLMHRAAVNKFELLPEDLPPTCATSRATSGEPNSSEANLSAPPSPVNRSCSSPASRSSSTPNMNPATNPSMPITSGPPGYSTTFKASTSAPAQPSTNLPINPQHSLLGAVEVELPSTTEMPTCKISSVSSEDTIPLKKLFSKGKEDLVNESFEAHMETNSVEAPKTISSEAHAKTNPKTISSEAHAKTNCFAPVLDENQPQSIPAHLLAISQALDSVYVPKDTYLKLETEKQKLTEEIEYMKSRVKELEQELEVSEDRRLQSENSASLAVQATKRLEKRVESLNSDSERLHITCLTLEESLSVQKECCQKLEMEKQELIENIGCRMSRVKYLEQELKLSETRRVDSENRTSQAMEAVKISEGRLDKLKSESDQMRDKIIEEFKSSNEFLSAVEEKAATYYINGFETCRSQFVNVGNLPEGFNMEFLDVSADEWGQQS